MKLNRFLLAVVFVASQLVIPRMANAAGEEITVQIKFRELCLTAQQTTTSKVSLANCRRDDSGQLFQIQKFPSTTKVQNGNFCLWAPKYGNGIDLQNSACKDSHLWSVDGKTLKLTGVSREYCLDIENGAASIGAVAQIWTCEYLGPGAAAQTFSLVELEFPVRVIGELPSTPSPGSTPSLDKPNREIIELPSTPSPGSTISPIARALTNPWIPVPHRPEARCVDYLFVGFRGSGEQPTGFDSNYKRTKKRALINWPESSFLGNVRSQRFKMTPAEDHLGRTLGELYDATRIRYQKLGKTIGFYSVGVSDAAIIGEGKLYAAVPPPKVNWAPWINSMNADSLNASGAVNGVIRRYRSQCGYTKILVAGYSQGAIMARVLTIQLGKPSNKIEGVMLVADPLFSTEDKTLAFPNDHQISGILRSNPLESCPLLGIVFAPICGALFLNIWIERETWIRSSDINKTILDQSAEDLLKWSKRVATICDSGDIVCSPVRVVSTPLPPPLNLKIDSDLLKALCTLPCNHTSYGKVKNPGEWWKARVKSWLG